MQNINKARINGLELDYGIEMNLMNIGAQYTYQEADDLTNDTLLSRRPRNKISLTLDRPFKNNQHLSIRFVGESKRDNSIYDTNRLGGYLVSHLHYTKRMGDINLGLTLNNIFDKKYRLAHNYNTDGRAFFISLTNSY